MDEFLVEMAEILEADVVKPYDRLSDFDSWDSLAGLSVVAMGDSRFGVKLTSADLRQAETIDDLFKVITAKKAA